MRRFSRPVVGQDHRDIAEWLELCHNAWILHNGDLPSDDEDRPATEAAPNLARDPEQAVLSAPTPVERNSDLIENPAPVHAAMSVKTTGEDTAPARQLPEHKAETTSPRRGWFREVWSKIVG
jgi:hypothetical protein